MNNKIHSQLLYYFIKFSSNACPALREGLGRPYYDPKKHFALRGVFLQKENGHPNPVDSDGLREYY